MNRTGCSRATPTKEPPRCLGEGEGEGEGEGGGKGQSRLQGMCVCGSVTVGSLVHGHVASHVPCPQTRDPSLPTSSPSPSPYPHPHPHTTTRPCLRPHPLTTTLRRHLRLSCTSTDFTTHLTAQLRRGRAGTYSLTLQLGRVKAEPAYLLTDWRTD